jgi:hypothetical protein
MSVLLATADAIFCFTSPQRIKRIQSGEGSLDPQRRGDKQLFAENQNCVTHLVLSDALREQIAVRPTMPGLE